ncbi:hypothetical protein AB1Y20_022508 [Prymnesium parvum]|uniref:Uncharacterized protein n=1 Tax=Prymnesium parvum TaxID=97485 RepID=A0AB34JGG4_PRYPA
MPLIVSIARWTQPDLLARARTDRIPQLVLIPYSNYCELARRSLAACGEFAEISRPPLLHILPTLALRFGSGTHVSTSSRMFGGRPGGSPTGVPVCAMPSGKVLVDSWSILDECAQRAGWSMDGLTPELRHLLDTKLGAGARTFAYSSLLRPECKNVWQLLLIHGQGWWWKVACRCGLADLLARRLIASFKLDDAAHMAGVRGEIDQALAEIGVLLSNTSSPFLAGARPGAADVAIATLCAPLVFPPNYCDGKYNQLWDLLLAQDVGGRSQVEAWRATAAGKHILKVYETFPSQAQR